MSSPREKSYHPRIKSEAGWPAAKSRLTHRLITGALWSLMGEMGARALSFLAAVCIARQLGVSEYGGFALIQNTLAAAMVFAGFGMGTTTTHYVAKLRDTDREGLGGITTLGFALSTITGIVAAYAVIANASYIAHSVFGVPELATPLRLAAPILILSSVSGAMGGIIMGFEAFDRLARISWFCGLVSLVASLVGVWTWGLVGAVAGLTIAELVRSVLLFWVARRLMLSKSVPFLAYWHARDLSILWKFSLPSVLGGMMHVPATWWCYAIIAHQPNGVAQIGIYDAAQKWMTLVVLVPLAASAAFGPVLTNLSGTGDTLAHKQTTGRLALTQLLLTIPPALGVAIAAPWAMDAFGPDFAKGIPVVMSLMVLAPIVVAVRLYWQSMLSLGRGWSSFASWTVWAFVAIALTSAWQGSGALGMAQAFIIAYSSALIISIVIIHRIYRLGTPTRLSNQNRQRLGFVQSIRETFNCGVVEARGHHFVGRPLGPNSLILDLGAHKGEFSEILRKRFGCHSIPVEANPSLCESWNAPSACINAAISDEPGKIAFVIAANTESSTLSKLNSNKQGTLVQVRSMTLQQLVGIAKDPRIALAKFDIEGAEIAVLLTSPAETLRRFDQITVEFHDFANISIDATDTEKVIDRLKRLGFISISFSRRRTDVLFVNRTSNIINRAEERWLRYLGRYAFAFKRRLVRLTGHG